MKTRGLCLLFFLHFGTRHPKTLQLRIRIDTYCVSSGKAFAHSRFLPFSIHSLRVKSNNHLQVLDARAQSGLFGGRWKGGGRKTAPFPPSCSHQSERKRYLVPLEMLGEEESTNPRAGSFPLILFYFPSFFFLRTMYNVWEPIVLIANPKLHY